MIRTFEDAKRHLKEVEAIPEKERGQFYPHVLHYARLMVEYRAQMKIPFGEEGGRN